MREISDEPDDDPGQSEEMPPPGKDPAPIDEKSFGHNLASIIVKAVKALKSGPKRE
jgi:hypothetical protein